MAPLAAKKRGAPTKAPGGLNKVLFVRAPQELLDAIDRLVRREQKSRPGVALTRSDFARELLYEALKRKKEGM